MSETHPPLWASAIKSYGRETPRSPAGRVCAARGCGTRLSVYNPEHYCWPHAVGRTPDLGWQESVAPAALQGIPRRPSWRELEPPATGSR